MPETHFFNSMFLSNIFIWLLMCVCVCAPGGRYSIREDWVLKSMIHWCEVGFGHCCCSVLSSAFSLAFNHLRAAEGNEQFNQSSPAPLYKHPSFLYKSSCIIYYFCPCLSEGFKLLLPTYVFFFLDNTRSFIFPRLMIRKLLGDLLIHHLTRLWIYPKIRGWIFSRPNGGSGGSCGLVWTVMPWEGVRLRLTASKQSGWIFKR